MGQTCRALIHPPYILQMVKCNMHVAVTLHSPHTCYINITYMQPCEYMNPALCHVHAHPSYKNTQLRQLTVSQSQTHTHTNTNTGSNVESRYQHNGDVVFLVRMPCVVQCVCVCLLFSFSFIQADCSLCCHVVTAMVQVTCCASST